RAQRVADLVGDGGGKAAERGQPRLPRLLALAREVLEKQQPAALEIFGRDVHRVALEGNLLRDRRGAGVGRGYPAGERRRYLVQHAAFRVVVQVEQGARAAVAHHDALVVVDGERAGGNQFDDLPVERVEIGDGRLAPQHRLLADTDALRELRDEERRG